MRQNSIKRIGEVKVAKDKNADKRYEFNLKISKNERESEELQLLQKEEMRSIENFENDMMQSFREYQQIEDEINVLGHQQNAFSEEEQKKRYFSQIIRSQKEEMIQGFKKAGQALEDQREILQKERDSLSWD
jgi:hypothetical protein